MRLDRYLERFSSLAVAFVIACSDAESGGITAPADSGAGGFAGTGGLAAPAGGSSPESGGRSDGGALTSGGGGIANGGGPDRGGSGGAMQGGASGSGGAGGASAEPRLRRVLAFELVDINPDTGALRGHNGGGADEALLQELGREHGFEVDVTNDGTPFTTASLSRYDVIAFCSPHYAGQELSAENRAAIEAFVRGGGGWLGWHYGLHIEQGWAFLKTLGGGTTALGHVGGEQMSTYSVVAPDHPVTMGLPKTFAVTDDFIKMSSDTSKNTGVTILATAALSAPPGGEGHPVIWVTEVGEGRAFYSMFGHNAPDFKTPVAKTLLWNALRWAARADQP